MKISRIIQVAYHRNGVSGVGFHAVIFEHMDDGAPLRMFATVFPERGAVAVVEVHSLAGGLGVTFGIYPDGNSWRSDAFEDELRAAIAEYERIRADALKASARETRDFNALSRRRPR